MHSFDSKKLLNLSISRRMKMLKFLTYYPHIVISLYGIALFLTSFNGIIFSDAVYLWSSGGMIATIWGSVIWRIRIYKKLSEES
jgi:hypothetical protein